jgi:hypothetical protein
MQKLDSRRRTDNATPPRGYPKSPFSSSLNDSSPASRRAHEQQLPGHKPLSMPVLSTRMGSVESPFSRWADSGVSAISPLNVNGYFGYRSPSERDEAEKSPRPYIRRSTSGSLSNSDDATNFVARSTGGGYDIVDDTEFPMEETSGLRLLHLDDGTIRAEGHSPPSTAGQKRRASSPPREDGPPSLHTVSSASDLFRRRESASRSSPTPRFHSSQSSVSSTAPGPRNSSYASNVPLAGSSVTTASSHGRLSPSGLSPGGVSPRSNDGSTDTPYITTASLTTSPRGSAASPIHRVLPERPLTTARKSSDTMSQTKRSSPQRHQGMLMCECCPKKPKKFETEEELK